MSLQRRTFLRLAGAAAMPSLGSASAGPKTGPLGKVVGQLPPGRHDDRLVLGDADALSYYRGALQRLLFGAAE